MNLLYLWFKPKVSAFMKNLISILKYLVPYWSVAILSVLFNLLAALFSVISFTMVIPILGLLFSTQNFVENSIPLRLTAESVQHNFNYYLGQVVHDEGQVKALLYIIIIVLVFTVLKNIFLYAGKSMIIHIRTNVVRDVRNELMNKILDFDLSYFSDERRGDIISKMIVDVKEIEVSIISSLEMLFKDPVLMAVYVYVLFVMSVKLTLIVLILFPVSAILIGQIGRNLKKGTFRGQERIGVLIGMLQETLSGIKIVKAFSAEKYVNERFKEQNRNFSNLFSKVWRRRSLANPVNDIIGTISILVIMWFGGKMVLSDTATLSSQVFIGYLAVFTQVISPAKSFSNGYYNVLKGLASVDRINSILNHQYKIDDADNATEIKEFKEKIEFRNVFFGYDDENKKVLDNISFTIEKGKTVAIVGHSGSGKSTIVDLIPRFYDPDLGDILIDSVSVKKYQITSLRNLFGYVNQEPVLFNDSIYNNLLFGNPDVSESEIKEAARRAFAHDFIIQKENGYQTNLGEDGSKLSLGEKQRISIARALLKNAPIMILDEATSALDYESEQLVQKALKELMKHRTTIIIAHRLSTIKNADKILVIDQGKIAEQGSHDELIKLNGKYKEMTEFEFL